MPHGSEWTCIHMSKRESIRYAFIKSIPVLCSYIFLGMAFGILMQQAGYAWYYAVMASVVVYTGAFQFVLTSLLPAGTPILAIAATALFMNSRQTFYALSYVDHFNQMGRKKLFMIHSLTDETFAVNYTLDLPPEDKRKVMYPLAIMCHCYWICGSLLGALIGQLIPFSTDGIDFCMTALFVIIFVDQWEKSTQHFPALLGLGVAVACLLIFGEGQFILPSLVIVSAILVVYNSRREKAVSSE